MSYKIAVASKDGITINQSFRDAGEFLIIHVNENGDYDIDEIRKAEEEKENPKRTGTWRNREETSGSCDRGCGDGTGCRGPDSPKLTLIADCRCVVCTRAGFKILKYLEKKAITVFEVDCQIKEAVEKIISYFEKVDTHQSLGGIAKK